MSVNIPTITGRPITPLVTDPKNSGGVPDPTVDNQYPTFQFVAGWVLFLTMLFFIGRTKLGYVAIYYSLILMILLILVAEYRQVAVLLSQVQTIGEFEAASNPKGA